MVKVKIFLMVLIFTIVGSVSAVHLKSHTIEKRIKPSGSVYVEGVLKSNKFKRNVGVNDFCSIDILRHRNKL